MLDVEHGLHFLILRDHKSVDLASVPPPPGVTMTAMHMHFAAESARDLLTRLGADADAFFAAIPAADLLTPREVWEWTHPAWEPWEDSDKPGLE